MLNVHRLADFASESYTKNERELLQEAFTKVIPIDEATFFGRNTEINKAQRIIDELLTIARNDRLGATSKAFAAKQNKLAKVLGDVFGFKALTINASVLLYHPVLLARLSTSSGCTLCKGAIFKAAEYITGSVHTKRVNVDKHHKAIKFTEASNYVMRMFISPTIFYDYGKYSLTSGEILAIILHEIGHNFEVGPVRRITVDVLNLVTEPDIVNYLVSMATTDAIIQLTEIVDVNIPDYLKIALTNMYNMFGVLLSPLSNVMSVYTMVNNLIMISLYLGSLLATLPIQIIKAALRYDSEKYSDTFATAYGYGAELPSALFKLSHVRIRGGTKYEATQTALDTSRFLLTLPVTLLYYLADEHPNNAARALNNMKYMKACRSSIKDPVVLKEYDESIAQLAKVIESTRSYDGVNLVSQQNKIEMLAGEFTKIADARDLISGLRPYSTTYKNLDVTI